MTRWHGSPPVGLISRRCCRTSCTPFWGRTMPAWATPLPRWDIYGGTFSSATDFITPASSWPWRGGAPVAAENRHPRLMAPLYVLGLTSAQMLVEVAGRYHYSLLPMLMLMAQAAISDRRGVRSGADGCPERDYKRKKETVDG